MFYVVPILFMKNICFKMQSNSDDSVTVTSTQSNEVLRRSGFRGRKNVKKRITLLQMIENIYVSQEKCIEWLKNKNLIPKILFCPKCNYKMKFEPDDQAIDGYIWICKECTDDPSQYSSRHGSWLESRNYPLPVILLYTYLWAHDFTVKQICKETNLPLSTVEEWNLVYCNICHSLYQRNIQRKQNDLVDGNSVDIDERSSAKIWREKNKSKDLFLQFLEDADSL